MTPERASIIAREHGCMWSTAPEGSYILSRRGEIVRGDTHAFVFAPHILDRITEPEFIAFYIPDGRD